MATDAQPTGRHSGQVSRSGPWGGDVPISSEELTDPMRRRLLTSLTLAAAAGTFLGLGLTALPTTAASADTSITATYPVSGSTYLKALNTTVPLGPGTLSSTLDLTTGDVTASTLTLPAATASFKEFGFIPVSATTAMIPVGTATGTASLSANTVSVTSQFDMQITSLKVGGLSIPVGRSCETRTPITTTISSQAGFSLLSGGNVAGSFTIPRFSHCGLATLLINLTIPGPGNTITLTLGAATL
jgi:hypothetical protein